MISVTINLHRYTEIIDLVYSKNTFTFSTFDWPHRIPLVALQLTPPIFPQVMFRDHFQRITSLDLQWTLISSEKYRDNLSFDPKKYEAWWGTILSMRRLRKIYLELALVGPPSPITEYICNVLNTPIEDLRHKNLEVCHIVAPEPYFRIFRKIENAPCTFSFINHHDAQAVRGDLGTSYDEGDRFADESGGRPYDDGDARRGVDDGTYFPPFDEMSLECLG
jgi:hypothetical protein